MPTSIGSSGVTFPDSNTQAFPSKVLQVVQTVLTSTFSTSSVSDTALTGLSASITPKSSTSKIMIIVEIGASACFNSNYGTFFSLYKNGSVITGALGVASGSRRQCTFGCRTYNFANYAVATTNYIDSPATTSSTTYAVYLGMESSNAGSSLVNTSGNSSNDATVPLSVSTITLMEIAP